jgi:hypothetical protein
MISDGRQTLARKSGSTNGYTTTVPSHPVGIDWNCDGQIESSVSENINGGIAGEPCDGEDNDGDDEVDEGCDRDWDTSQTLAARSDWFGLPAGKRCLLGDAERIGDIGYPSDYVDDAYAPPCPSQEVNTAWQALPQQDDPSEPHEETEEDESALEGLPDFEVCDGKDNDGDADIDEGCADADKDGIANDVDNCPWVANADQADYNGDFRGNACDGRPGAPMDVRAEITEGGIRLTWSAPETGDSIGYNVYRRLAGDQNYRHLGSYPTTEKVGYTDSGATRIGGEHVYLLRALSPYAEEGDASTSVRVTIQHRAYLPIVIRLP